MCSANVNFGSKVRPRILGKGFVVSRLLLISRFSDLEYSAGSGVKSVHWVLVVFIIRLFSVDQVAIELRYGCRFVSASL